MTVVLLHAMDNHTGHLQQLAKTLTILLASNVT